MGTGKQWEIEGYDSTRLIFSKNIPFGLLSEPEIITLLRRLVSRHLTPGEIVAASLRRNAAGYAPLLRTIRDATVERFLVSVGTNPYYTAIVRHVPLAPEGEANA
jgi:hypothetical protein